MENAAPVKQLVPKNEKTLSMVSVAGMALCETCMASKRIRLCVTAHKVANNPPNRTVTAGP